MSDDLIERLEGPVSTWADCWSARARGLEAAARIRELEAAQGETVSICADHIWVSGHPDPTPVTVSEAARERVARAVFPVIADRMGWHHRIDEHPVRNTKFAVDVADAALRALAGQGGE